MRLTKKKAIELSLEKWEDYVKTGENNAEGDWHERHGYPTMSADCALCEYGDRRKAPTCGYCPYHAKFGFCLDEVYLRWRHARTPEASKKYAKEFLAQLKELK